MASPHVLTQVLRARQNQTYRGTVFVSIRGVAIDLTGYTTLRMDFRLPGDPVDTPTIRLEKVATDIEGLRIVDAMGGEIAVLIDQDPTLADIPNSTGLCTLSTDLLAIGPSGDLEVFLVGEMELSTGVTQP